MARAEPDEEKAPTGPRHTSALFGQATAEAALLSAYRSGRMHHGWLLAGPAGIGKATLAHRLARFIAACPDHRADEVQLAENLAVADDHPACRRIRAGAFPDLVEMTAQTSETAAGRGRPVIKVEMIHHGLQRLTTTPAAGGWRVIIVDAAEDMNLTAANAILKRLEEPPGQTIFMLITHAPGRLLPTIRSRCRRLDLVRLGEGDVRRALAGIGDGVRRDTVGGDIIALADGSPGEALRLLDRGGAELANELMQLVGQLPNLDMAMAHKLADRLTGNKADPEFRLFVELLLDWLAGAVRSAETGCPGKFATLEPRSASNLFETRPLAPWAALWENLNEDQGRMLGLNLDRKQFLMTAFFALESTARRLDLPRHGQT